MVAIVFSVAILLPSALIVAGHYFPWTKTLNRELSKVEAYIYGTLAINGTVCLILLALEILSLSIRPSMAMALIMIAVASAGITTMVLYKYDESLEMRHRLMDAEERQNERRLQG
jgi:hypothetical protein